MATALHLRVNLHQAESRLIHINLLAEAKNRTNRCDHFGSACVAGVKPTVANNANSQKCNTQPEMFEHNLYSLRDREPAAPANLQGIRCCFDFRHTHPRAEVLVGNLHSVFFPLLAFLPGLNFLALVQHEDERACCSPIPSRPHRIACGATPQVSP